MQDFTKTCTVPFIKGEVAEYKTKDGKYVAASFWGLAEAAIEAELAGLDEISIDPTAEGYNYTEIEKGTDQFYPSSGTDEPWNTGDCICLPDERCDL